MATSLESGELMDHLLLEKPKRTQQRNLFCYSMVLKLIWCNGYSIDLLLLQRLFSPEPDMMFGWETTEETDFLKFIKLWTRKTKLSGNSPGKKWAQKIPLLSSISFLKLPEPTKSITLDTPKVRPKWWQVPLWCQSITQKNWTFVFSGLLQPVCITIHRLYYKQFQNHLFWMDLRILWSLLGNIT